jgi:hypothetical protein
MRTLIKEQFRFVWIDEVSFNPRSVKYMNWIDPIDPSDVTFQFQRGGKSTAICALTDEGVLHSVVRTGNNSSREILLFLIDLEKALKKQQGNKFDEY